MALRTDLLKLTKRLYPTGRAFAVPVNEVIEKLHKGLNESEAELIEEAKSVLNSIIPDNDNFTLQDALDWERRLGISSDIDTPLSEKKLAIYRKYGHPGAVKARSSYRYIEKELQDAGFNVYVHENLPVAQVPSDFTFYSSLSMVQLGQVGLGESVLGGTDLDIVANSIYENVDSVFSIGSDVSHVFWISDAVKGEPAIVSASRRKEFRQLILKLKPAHMVAVLMINYS